MPRGGKRKGAGRKTTWTSGRSIADTTVIRVPKEFANDLLAIAHKLDAGEDMDFVTNSNNDIVTQSSADVVQVQIANLLTQLKDIANQVKVRTVQRKKILGLINDLELAISCLQTTLENVTDSEKNTTLDRQITEELVTESKETEEDATISAPNELVTNLGEQIGLLDEPHTFALSTKELAARLGTTFGSFSVQKSKFKDKGEKFLQWIQEKDPDGLRWIELPSRGKAKLYAPEGEISPSLLRKLKSINAEAKN